MILVPSNESKEKIKKIADIWSKNRDLSRSLNKNSDVYDEKYVEIKFSSDGALSLNKMIDISSIIIVVIGVFHENNKYYSQVFLDESLYRL